MNTRHKIGPGYRPMHVLLLAGLLSISACGNLEPVAAPDLCDHGCSRDQFASVLKYWESEGNAVRFYGWLQTLGDEQLDWIRDSSSNPLTGGSNRLSPGDHLLRAIVLFNSPANPQDLVAAVDLVEYYLGHAARNTDEYAFALLLQSSLSDRLDKRKTFARQQLALEDMQDQVGHERSARQSLEHQLEQLKQIEESLLGSNKL